MTRLPQRRDVYRDSCGNLWVSLGLRRYKGSWCHQLRQIGWPRRTEIRNVTIRTLMHGSWYTRVGQNLKWSCENETNH